MQDIGQWIGYVSAGMIGLYLLVSAVGAFSVRALSKAIITPVDEHEAQRMRLQAEQSVDADWLSQQGFEPVGCYQLQLSIGSPGIVGWKHAGGSIFFCYYLMPNNQNSSDFVSIMSDRSVITTGTQVDGLLFPPTPGSSIQVFPDKTLDERWALHLEAETAVTEATDISPAETIGTLDQEILYTIAGQLTYIRSLLLWPLRIPWWYIVRRFGLVNKTIADQINPAASGPR